MTSTYARVGVKRIARRSDPNPLLHALLAPLIGVRHFYSIQLHDIMLFVEAVMCFTMCNAFSLVHGTYTSYANLQDINAWQLEAQQFMYLCITVGFMLLLTPFCQVKFGSHQIRSNHQRLTPYVTQNESQYILLQDANNAIENAGQWHGLQNTILTNNLYANIFSYINSYKLNL